MHPFLAKMPVDPDRGASTDISWGFEAIEERTWAAVHLTVEFWILRNANNDISTFDACGVARLLQIASCGQPFGQTTLLCMSTVAGAGATVPPSPFHVVVHMISRLTMMTCQHF
jgi:hypothetical protein